LRDAPAVVLRDAPAVFRDAPAVLRDAPAVLRVVEELFFAAGFRREPPDPDFELPALVAMRNLLVGTGVRGTYLMRR
jgi:hypothetical protein